MKRGTRWADWLPRVALAAALTSAAIGVLDRQQRWAEVALRPDHLDHVVICYVLTLAMLATFRRAPPLVIGILVMATGVGLEIAQALGLFAGDGEIGDVVADLGGVAIALCPHVLGRVHAQRDLVAQTA